jgi:hypothetical protein
LEYVEFISSDKLVHDFKYKFKEQEKEESADLKYIKGL